VTSTPTRPLPDLVTHLRKHIVVLHTDPVMLDLERELLAEEQYRVTATNTDTAAAELIGGLHPDLVLIELQYRDVVAWDVLVSLTEAPLTRELPIIVTSTDVALLEHARELHPGSSTRRFISAPFDLEVLLGLIGELIGVA
jgi:CheY-like chemotaxis protein